MNQIRGAQIFGWLCLMGGAALIAWGWFNLDQGRASRDWPTASATVESSSVRARRSGRSSQESYRYSPEIRFRYEVNGASYTGDRVSFRDDHYGKRGPAAEITARYRPGDEVIVYYPPDDPSQAVLEPDYDWSTYIPPAIGLMFFFGGFGILSGVRRHLQKQSPPRPY